MKVQISVCDERTGRTETMDHNSHGLVGELESAVRKRLGISDEQSLSLHANGCALDDDLFGMVSLCPGSVLRVGRTVDGLQDGGPVETVSGSVLQKEVMQRAVLFGRGISVRDQSMNLVRGNGISMFE